MSDSREEVASSGGAGPLLLAAGGLAAAFGAASCCALPMLLALLGAGGTWLATVAGLAAPHRIALLVTATVCLVASGFALWRRSRAAAACTSGTSCKRPTITTLTVGLLSIAAVLAVLGFVYA